MSSITAHDKMSDGSYRVVVTDDNGVERIFFWAPLDPTAKLHEGGASLTEDDYVAQQSAEALAIVASEAAVVPSVAENLLA